MRFSLRWLMLAIAALAVCLFTAKNSDWVAGVGLFVAFLLFDLSRRKIDWPFLPRVVRGGLLMAAMLLGWFMVVDRFVTMESCWACYMYHFNVEYRILGVAVVRTRSDDHDDFLCRMATDLGKPCNHRYIDGAKWRHWGLLIPARPFHRGIIAIVDERDYDDIYGDRIIELGKRHPELADEFHEKILNPVDMNWGFMYELELRLEEMEEQE
jgi:hypothetical protein